MMSKFFHLSSSSKEQLDEEQIKVCLLLLSCVALRVYYIRQIDVKVGTFELSFRQIRTMKKPPGMDRLLPILRQRAEEQAATTRKSIVAPTRGVVSQRHGFTTVKSAEVNLHNSSAGGGAGGGSRPGSPTTTNMNNASSKLDTASVPSVQAKMAARKREKRESRAFKNLHKPPSRYYLT